jgi:hypothetical protein
MRVLFGAAGVLLLATSAGAAADSKDQSAEKVICKRVYDADTGSHFQSSKRVCHTASEWKDIEDGNERTMRALREHGGISPGSGAPAVGSSPQ